MSREATLVVPTDTENPTLVSHIVSSVLVFAASRVRVSAAYNDTATVRA